MTWEELSKRPDILGMDLELNESLHGLFPKHRGPIKKIETWPGGAQVTCFWRATFSDTDGSWNASGWLKLPDHFSLATKAHQLREVGDVIEIIQDGEVDGRIFLNPNESMNPGEIQNLSEEKIREFREFLKKVRVQA